MSVSPRVRFAPSPTGFLHLGGARTALFNWLFARQQGGTFILRIEDTDQVRSEPRFLDDIVESLQWLDLDWDEGPLFQSQRGDLYAQYIQQLLDEGLAYTEPPPEGAPADAVDAVRFHMPQERVVFEDQIRGEIAFEGDMLNDLVIRKSDGTPTYHLACVVDDAIMNISHVIRGEDHISNMPKQLPLFRALGWKPPQYAHLPLILGSDRSRLSKRHGAVSVTEFRQQGFEPQVMFNYLSLLGWSPKDDREVLSREEILEAFSIKGVKKTGASFDVQKLTWLNGQHLKQLSVEEAFARVKPLWQSAGYLDAGVSEERLLNIVRTFQDRAHTIEELATNPRFIFEDAIEHDAEAVDKLLRVPDMASRLSLLAERLDALEVWDEASIEHVIRGVGDELGVKGKDVILPTRVAVTGTRVSPGVFEVLVLVGQARTVDRLRYASEHLCDLVTP